MPKKDFDAVVVGSGPNGLAAAITLQQADLSVFVAEAADTTGGGLTTKELTLPGFRHDVCSAIHPLAAESPFFKTSPLHLYGLEYVDPPISAAHPFDGGQAAFLTRSVDETAGSLGVDSQAYMDLILPFLKNWEDLAPEILDELHIPRHPFKLAEFGLKAMTSASFLAGKFKSREARGLWAGTAAHSILPLDKLSTSAIGLVLSTVGHLFFLSDVSFGLEVLSPFFPSTGRTPDTVNSFTWPVIHLSLPNIIPKTVAGESETLQIGGSFSFWP